MKKLFILSLISLSCFVFIGCNKYLNITKNSLAEIRYNIFVGNSDNFDITFMSGKREKNYVINGYNTELIDFGVLTVTLKDNNLNYSNSSFALTIDTLRYEGLFERNPFDDTLVSDIGVLVDNNVQCLNLKIIVDNISEDITLSNISYDWNVDCNDALKIATKQLNEELTPLITSEFLGEIYVKIIPDTINNKNYLWYVNFVSRDGIKHSVLINPITKEILAKK